MDIYVLIMRVPNRLWSEDDIVDVFPITQAPEPGPYGQIKHAAIIVRGIPFSDTPESFWKAKTLLTRQNLADDSVASDPLHKRRWFINRSELPASVQTEIATNGYTEIAWADLLNAVWKKEHGIEVNRRLSQFDITGETLGDPIVSMAALLAAASVGALIQYHAMAALYG